MEEAKWETSVKPEKENVGMEDATCENQSLNSTAENSTADNKAALSNSQVTTSQRPKARLRPMQRFGRNGVVCLVHLHFGSKNQIKTNFLVCSVCTIRRIPNKGINALLCPCPIFFPEIKL